MRIPSLRPGLVATAAFALLACAPVVLAQQVQYEIPPDPHQKLQTMDRDVLVTQRALFAARQHGDQAAVKKLTKQFKDIEHKRGQVIKEITEHPYE
jgi:hypothetical protein